MFKGRLMVSVGPATLSVVPAQAGTHLAPPITRASREEREMGSRLRGNDGGQRYFPVHPAGAQPGVPACHFAKARMSA